MLPIPSEFFVCAVVSTLLYMIIFQRQYPGARLQDGVEARRDMIDLE